MTPARESLLGPGLCFPGAGGGELGKGDQEAVRHYHRGGNKSEEGRIRGGQAEGVRRTNWRLGLRLDYLSASSPN